MKKLYSAMDEIDRFVSCPDVAPFYGWHDDHRACDGTPDYMPAMQQTRAEFLSLLSMVGHRRLHYGRCLQLGLGPSGASHSVWRRVFDYVVTIDWSACLVNNQRHPGMDTHSQEAIDFAAARKPYDFLFIDAGHSYGDVAADFISYGYMVRRGGLIAFHDALPRARYPEIEVHKFIEHLPVEILGDEVGTAVMEVT